MNAALFDLDNTLYSAETQVFPLMDKRINRYMNEIVGIPENDVNRLRQKYWQLYGLTLNGLMRHHNVDPENYLAYIHDLDVHNLLSPDPALRECLKKLPVRKVVFTNSTREHAERVLSALELSDIFEKIFDIRAADFKPKPYPEAYRKILGCLNLEAKQCVMVDDAFENLKTAKEMGMKTILLGKSGHSNSTDAEAENPCQSSEIIKIWLKNQDNADA